MVVMVKMPGIGGEVLNFKSDFIFSKKKDFSTIGKNIFITFMFSSNAMVNLSSDAYS